MLGKLFFLRNLWLKLIFSSLLLLSLDSYFCKINQQVRSKTLFPVGHLTKNDVRGIAQKEGLNWLLKRRSSKGICFVGKQNDFAEFLTNNFKDEMRGEIIDIDTLEKLGTHTGHFEYTIGQVIRKDS